MTASSSVPHRHLELASVAASGVRRLEARGYPIADGVVADRVLLEVPGATEQSSIDELQRTTPTLHHFEVSVSLETVLRQQLQVGRIECVPEGKGLVVGIEENGAILGARLSFVPGPIGTFSGARALGVDLGVLTRFGPERGLGEELFDAVERGLGSGEVLGRCPPRAVILDPVPGLLRAVFPQNGWKLPSVDGLGLRVELSSSGLLVLVLEPHVDSSAFGREQADLAHLVETSAPKSALRWDPQDAFHASIEALDDRGEPIPRRAQALWLAGLSEALYDEGLRLATEALEFSPTDLDALSFVATIADREPGRAVGEALERLAERLRQRGERRRPSKVLQRAALRASGSGRARLFEESVVLCPEDTGALRGLVDALVPLGRTRAAIRAVRRLASLGRQPEEKAQAHFQAGQLLAEEGDLAGAGRELEKAAREAPNDTSVVIALADNRAERGDLAGAQAALESALLSTDTRGESQRAFAEAQARLLLKSGNAEEALPIVQRLLEEDPVNPTILLTAFAVVEAAPDQTEIEDAALWGAAQFLSVSEIADRSGVLRLHVAAAGAHERAGRLEPALNHLEAAWALGAPSAGPELDALIKRAENATLDNDDVQLRRRLGRASAHVGALEEATRIWRPLFETLEPHDPIWRETRKDLSRALEAHPRSRVLLDLAVEVSRQGKDLEAQAEMLQARARLEDPPSLRAMLLSELARTWRSMGRPLAAVRAFEEAAVLVPDRTQFLEQVADIHRARDDRPRLAEVLGRLAPRSEGPARGERYAERARILAALGEDEAAHEAVVAALEAGDEGTMTWSLATVLALRLGRFEEAGHRARSRLERLDEASPEQRLPIWVDLARVAEAQGNEAELRQALSEAVRLADPRTAVGRHLADRLAHELERGGDQEALIALELHRGRDLNASAADRAGWLVRAAARLAGEGRSDEAMEAAEAVLALNGHGESVEKHRDRALDILEQQARARGNSERLAEVLGARADRLGREGRGQQLRLEQLELLEEAGRVEAALQVVQRAAETYPESLMLAARLGGVAEAAGDLLLSAEAFARAAALAERGAKPELAPGLHRRAARALLFAGEPQRALRHDEAVVAGARGRGPATAEVMESLERLESSAHDGKDGSRRMELLQVRAELSSGPARAAAYEELGSLALSEGRIDEALSAFESALASLGEADRARAEALHERLDSARASIGRSVERVEPLERRAKAEGGPVAGQLWLRAAKILLDDLNAPEAALNRVEAAVRSDPEDEEARSLRLSLLRRIGPAEFLVEILEEEGSRASDVEVASSLWVEASEVLLSEVADDGSPEDRLSRVLELSRRAAAATPRAAVPLRLALRAVEAQSGREDDELSLLAQLAERTPSPEERLTCRLRRARLLDDSFANPTSALAELEVVLDAPEAPRKAALRTVMEVAPSPERAFFEWGADLAVKAQKPEAAHLFLSRWQASTRDADEAAYVGIRRAKILEEYLDDENGAEDAWLQVLSARPEDQTARTALLRRFVAARRFEDIAHHLGIELLDESWDALPETLKRGAAEALWPLLPSGSRRAEVMLWAADDRLASISDPGAWSSDEITAGGGSRTFKEVDQLLTEVAESGTTPFAGQAWERLAKLRSQRADLSGAAAAQEARARGTDDADERVEALAALADLRLELGDVDEAEQALREARQIRPRHRRVMEAMRRHFTAAGRFDELGSELGPQALEEVVEDLLAESERSREAFWAATCLANLQGPDAGSLWLRVADAMASHRAVDLEVEALEAAAEGDGGPARAALSRLRMLAEQAGDARWTTDVLRRHLQMAAGRAESLELHLALAAELRAWTADGGPDSALEEASEILIHARSVFLNEERVDRALESLWMDIGDFHLIGQHLGLDRLAHLAKEARQLDEPSLERQILTAWASLASGPDRAEVLLRIADNASLTGDDEAELEALSLAFSVSPERSDVQHRMLDVLVGRSDFGHFLATLGMEALAQWVESNRGHQGFAAAGEALAAAWRETEAVSVERIGSLWFEVGERYLLDGRASDAERAFRAALTATPQAEDPRQALAQLLAETNRFSDLAEVDLERLAAIPDVAEEAGDLQRAGSALRALAERRSGTERAAVLFQLSRILRGTEGPAAEEESLLSARSADPADMAVARRLSELLWERGAFETLAEVLGSSELLDQFDRAAAIDAASALDALPLARAHLGPSARADAGERAAAVQDPRLPPDSDLQRRKDLLVASRFTWDQTGDIAGGERVRLAMVQLLRDGSDRVAYLDALQDAWDEVRTASERSWVGLELAGARGSESPDEARTVLEAVLLGAELPLSGRQDAAQALVDLYASQERPEHLDATSRGVLHDAYELLHATATLDLDGLKRLAALREAASYPASEVAQPLEAALAGETSDAIAVASVHAQLRDIWDAAGDWRRAEPHAAAVAEYFGRAEDWLALADLRAWNDDLDGAEVAAQAAAQTEPRSPRVQELLVRLAERRGDHAALASRLADYGSLEDGSSPTERADLFMDAGRAALRVGDVEKAATHFRRAASLDGRADRAIELDGRMRAEPRLDSARLEVLLAGLSSDQGQSGSRLRLLLVEDLERLGRAGEAIDVLRGAFEKGQDVSENILEAALSPERAVPERELLSWADSLGEGLAADRLRREAASRAETKSDLSTARAAWTQIAERAGPQQIKLARESLVRLARDGDDPTTLVKELEEAAEDAGTEPRSVELWLEAAEVAEQRLSSVDRAASLLDRGHRSLGAPALAEAFIDLHRRHGRWLGLDSWLERQRSISEGEVRARWSRLRAETLRDHLEDAPAAAQLFAESYELSPNNEVGLLAARAEAKVGAHEACAHRAAALLAGRKLERTLYIPLVLIRVEALQAVGRPQEAASVLKEAVEALPDAEILFDTRLRLLARNFGPDATALALAMDASEVPDFVFAERRISAARIAQDFLSDRVRAETWLEEASARSVTSLAGRLAEAAFAVERPDLAREALEAGLEGGAIRPSRQIQLDRAELALRSFDLADFLAKIADAEPLLTEPDELARAASLRAAAADAEGDRASARAGWAEAARRLEPMAPKESAELWSRYARCAAADGQTDLALAAVKRVEGLCGSSAELENEVLDAHATTRARADGLRARAGRGPTDLRAWEEVADLYAALGLDEEADSARLEAQLAGGSSSDIRSVAAQLQQQRRWTELVALLETHLQRGSIGWVQEQSTRLEIAKVALRLGDPAKAELHLEQARGQGSRHPSSSRAPGLDDDLDLSVLEALKEAKLALDDDLAAADILDEISARTLDEETRLTALLEAARLHAEHGAFSRALDALASTVAPGDSQRLRAWAEHAEHWAQEAGHPERAARAWVQYGMRAKGQEAAAALAKAASIRWHVLEDRRGALAAVDIARHRSPEDTGIAWMAIDMHARLGDPDGSASHARRAAELATGPARTAFWLEVARTDGALESWREALSDEDHRERVLEHLAASVRFEPRPDIEAFLSERGWLLPLSHSLSSESFIELDEDKRAELDVGGRWTELARLEAARAETLDDPRARAEAWLSVSEIYGRVRDPTARAEERVALERAVDSDSLNPRALGAALQAAVEDRDLSRARDLAQRLAELGGAPWPPPELELTMAEAYDEEPASRAEWLELAILRDPAHREAMERLALHWAEAGALGEARRWAEAWKNRIDPALEPGALGRCRRLLARLDRENGDLHAALAHLDPNAGEDAAERFRILEALEASVDDLADTLEKCFDHDHDPQHLLQAASLGVQRDSLESRALALSPPSWELERLLLSACAEAGDSAKLLFWARRRGATSLGSLRQGDRWAVARAALMDGDAALVGNALEPDRDVEGLEEVFGDGPLAAFVNRLDGSREPEARLLSRLWAYRPEDSAVALAQSRVRLELEEADTAMVALAARTVLRDTPDDLDVLRRLVEATNGAGPAAALTWLEFGEDTSLPTDVDGPGTSPSHLGFSAYAYAPFPWTRSRLLPAESHVAFETVLGAPGCDHLPSVSIDPEGGERVYHDGAGGVVFGRALVELATPAELRFHLGRARVLEELRQGGSSDWSPERFGLVTAGSLFAAIEGLLRSDARALLRPLRSLDDRRQLIRSNKRVRDLFLYAVSPGLPLHREAGTGE